LQKTRDKIRQIWLDNIGHSVDNLINQLNPVIRGIVNYYRQVTDSEIFSKLDSWMYIRGRRYAARIHPNKSQQWRHKRYWGRLNLERNDNWVFGNKQTKKHLLKFSWFKIKRHPLVKGKASPDDPNLKEYWEKRGKLLATTLTPSFEKIARKQGFICPHCGESLFNGESIQRHHKIPHHLGGKDSYANLELAHYYCHQQIHSSNLTHDFHEY
jgi:RNA-directed DNA polymerase